MTACPAWCTKRQQCIDCKVRDANVICCGVSPAQIVRQPVLGVGEANKGMLAPALTPWSVRSVQDGYSVRDQVLCDLLHVFEVTLRGYKPLQLANPGAHSPGKQCACQPEQLCSCATAARLKLSHLQADAQVILCPPWRLSQAGASVQASGLMTEHQTVRHMLYESLPMGALRHRKGYSQGCEDAPGCCRCCGTSSIL